MPDTGGYPDTNPHPHTAGDSAARAADTALTIQTMPETRKWSLRTKDPASVSRAVGIALPTRIGTVSVEGARAALCLGPDEWLLMGEPAATPSVPHSLVDVSARDMSIAVSGPMARDAIAMGCPRDLRRFSEGSAARTIFDGTTIVLWRRTADEYEVTVARSFAPFLLRLLHQAADELALGI